MMEKWRLEQQGCTHDPAPPMGGNQALSDCSCGTLLWQAVVVSRQHPRHNSGFRGLVVCFKLPAGEPTIWI